MVGEGERKGRGRGEEGRQGGRRSLVSGITGLAWLHQFKASLCLDLGSSHIAGFILLV